MIRHPYTVPVYEFIVEIRRGAGKSTELIDLVSIPNELETTVAHLFGDVELVDFMLVMR